MLVWAASPTFSFAFWLQLGWKPFLCMLLLGLFFLYWFWMDPQKYLRLNNFSKYFIYCSPGWIYVASHFTVFLWDASCSCRWGSDVESMFEWWVNLLKEVLTCTLCLCIIFKEPCLKVGLFWNSFFTCMWRTFLFCGVWPVSVGYNIK